MLDESAAQENVALYDLQTVSATCPDRGVLTVDTRASAKIDTESGEATTYCNQRGLRPGNEPIGMRASVEIGGRTRLRVEKLTLVQPFGST